MRKRDGNKLSDTRIGYKKGGLFFMAFDITNFFNEESKKELKNDWKVVKINIHKLHPAENKKNFYHIDDEEVRLLARTIELVGLEQYPVVRKIEGTEEYELIAGHKRRMAILFLLEEGKKEYEMVPCKVESKDHIKNELALIFTNSTQRERTDYEKMQEVKRVRELLAEYQKKHEVSGKKQNIIAEILNINKTKVGMLEKIDKKLIKPFKDEFATGKINVTTADKIAGLAKEEQQKEYESFQKNGSVSTEIKKTKEKLLKSCDGNTIIEEKIPQEKQHKEEKKVRDKKIHEIEVTVVPFYEIKNKVRTFEVRKNDRDYQVDDILHLYEYANGSRTGRMIKAKVKYIMNHNAGLQKGYCILELNLLSL